MLNFFGRGCLLTLLMLIAATGNTQALDGLIRQQTHKAHRIASSDPAGGNFDMRRIEPGQSLELAKITGPAIINHLWFTIMYESRTALRKLVLRIYFDDSKTPAVEAPLGDFFGLGHALSYSYASQPLAVGTHTGLNSYWLMPFAKSARIVVANEGKQVCQAFYFQIDYQDRVEVPKPVMYFHAQYRQEFPPSKGKTYTILEAAGASGHYVGCNLSIEQRDESWWGEGDMRIYVDGETTPSIAGTGSEDDFSGAWCYSHEFSFPQFGAPLRSRFDATGLLQHCTPDLKGKDLDQWKWPVAWQPGDLWNVYRYHITDPVPFQKSVRVDIEHGYINNERSDWMSSVAYWYQSMPQGTNPVLASVADRMPYYVRPREHPKGVFEAENFADTAPATSGIVLEAGMEFWGTLFSGRSGLQWKTETTGSVLDLSVELAKEGTYDVSVRAARNEPGGSFTVSLDDAVTTSPVDLFQQGPFLGMIDIPLGTLQLTTGTHHLKFQAHSKHEKQEAMKLLLDRIDLAETTASVTGKTPVRQ
jgi:hypothetical protein